VGGDLRGNDEELNDNLPNMAPPRQTPHRSRRETQEVRASEVQEFRAENQKLRRENARLRRELEKYLSAWGTNSAGEPEDALAGNEKKAKPAGMGCLMCGGDKMVRIKMGAKTIVGCKDCKHRFTE
jgi:regulator of replication initiation timing